MGLWVPFAICALVTCLDATLDLCSLYWPFTVSQTELAEGTWSLSGAGEGPASSRSARGTPSPAGPRLTALLW